MGYRQRVAVALGVASLLMSTGCGAGGDDPTGNGPSATGTPTATGSPAVEPVTGDDGPAGAGCATGEFQLGAWDLPGATEPGRVTGLAADGDGSCARLRISFDGPAPGVKVWRPSEGNHTYVSLAADFPNVDPAGPVENDLLWPDLALLSTAILTSDRAGLTVAAIHGDRMDVAARAQVAEQHVDIYFRTAQSGDARVNDTWPGGPHHLELAGETDQGLLVTHTGTSDGEWVLIQGYAKSPESNVVVRVQLSGLGVACDHEQLAAGPPYLYSWFHDACQVPFPDDYLIQVGWHSPAGPTQDVWQWYDVSVA